MAAILLLPLASTAAGKATLTIAADRWCPINCGPEDARQGVGIDLARAVFESNGYAVKYVVMPWSRALDEVRRGNIDAVVGANATDDDTLVYPHSAIYLMSDDLYVRADSPIRFTSMDSLKGQRIGVIRNYGYGADVTAFLRAERSVPGRIQEISGDDVLLRNIRKLLAGRIDVLIECRPIMDYTLAQEKLEGKLRHIGSVPQSDVYVGFSPVRPESADLAAMYDRGIARLKEEGRLAALYAPYRLSPP